MVIPTDQSSTDPPSLRFSLGHRTSILPGLLEAITISATSTPLRGAYIYRPSEKHLLSAATVLRPDPDHKNQRYPATRTLSPSFPAALPHHRVPIPFGFARTPPSPIDQPQPDTHRPWPLYPSHCCPLFIHRLDINCNSLVCPDNLCRSTSCLAF